LRNWEITTHSFSIIQLLNFSITQYFDMTVNSQIRSKASRGIDSGYIMLTLVLLMATMAIFAAVIVPSITFEIKRDREEEMIHRGVQYSRAIRAYYKKTGRYPIKIEDLENTNNQRFLRKRYKDPLNCKNGKCADFKLLHFGEVQMTLSALGGGVVPGAPSGGLNGTSAGSSFGASPTSAFGQNPQAGPPGAGSDPSQPGSQTAADGTGDGTGTNPSGTGTGAAGTNPVGSGQIIGGPIVGVASTSKDNTIREFNHKKKYKDWVFVYDPAQDQGRLIMTPYQPQLAGFAQQGAPPNANGQNGSSSSFGSSGSGNNSNSPTSPGFGAPNPPSNPPPPQQQ
jgi:type II secretory pathway pseudopilin PulG